MLAVVILESATVPCVCMVGCKASMGYSAVEVACVFKVLTVAAPVAGFCVCLVIEFELLVLYCHALFRMAGLLLMVLLLGAALL